MDDNTVPATSVELSVEDATAGNWSTTTQIEQTTTGHVPRRGEVYETADGRLWRVIEVIWTPHRTTAARLLVSRAWVPGAPRRAAPSV